MRYDKMRGRIIPTIILFVLLMVTTTPCALAQNDTAQETNSKIISMTGQIDRIGSGDIVINDTWFKISEDVSLKGYKVGDRVSIKATSQYYLIELRPTPVESTIKE